MKIVQSVSCCFHILNLQLKTIGITKINKLKVELKIHFTPIFQKMMVNPNIK